MSSTSLEGSPNCLLFGSSCRPPTYTLEPWWMVAMVDDEPAEMPPAPGAHSAGDASPAPAAGGGSAHCLAGSRYGGPAFGRHTSSEPAFVGVRGAAAHDGLADADGLAEADAEERSQSSSSVSSGIAYPDFGSKGSSSSMSR